MNSEQQINDVKDRHAEELFRKPGVVGVGVEQDDKGKFVLTVHVESDDPDILSVLPQQVEGYDVRVIPSGKYRKL
jgi:hypothetical protein